MDYIVRAMQQEDPSPADKRKSYILNLIRLAQADGKWHDNEKKFIASIAERIGLTDEEHHDVIFHPERVRYVSARSEAERIMLLYDLLFMMKMDGNISDSEEDLCLEIGFRLGFSPLMLSEMIDVMRTYKTTRVPDNSLIDILKKYMN
jgi:hypothetical protein